MLDWSAAHVGEPERDVASTFIVIKSFGPLISSEREANWVAENYLEAYRKIGKLDMDKLDFYKAVNCIGYLEWIDIGGNQAIPESVSKRLINYFKE